MLPSMMLVCVVEHHALDPGSGQQRLQPGQADGVVGAQQFLHRPSRGSRLRLDRVGLDPRASVLCSPRVAASRQASRIDEGLRMGACAWPRSSSARKARAKQPATLDRLTALVEGRSRARQRAHPRAHAEPGGAHPAARRPHHRRRRQAAAPDADPGLGADVRLSRRPPHRRSPRRSSSSTPRRCCTTTWSTPAICAAGSPPPTRSGATSPRCWSAISCSAAPSS